MNGAEITFERLASRYPEHMAQFIMSEIERTERQVKNWSRPATRSSIACQTGDRR